MGNSNKKNLISKHNDRGTITIPDEIIALILKYIPKDHKYVALLISKQWLQVIKKTYKYKISADQFSRFMKYISSNNLLIDDAQLELEMHDPSMSELRELSQIKCLKKITFMSKLNNKEFGLITSMKNVVHLDMNFNDSLMDLLIQIENLQYLTMRGTIPNISSKLGRMKNLTYLEF